MTTPDDDIRRYREDGYLVVAQAITPAQLDALRTDFDQWVGESRGFDHAYGTISDGRPRFDVEPGHSAASPALRRVASPQDVSEAYLGVMRDNHALDTLTHLIGPNIRFNHAKVNSKLPGSATVVKYHQDFMYEPHSNDDLATVLIFLDDVTDENGPLEVVPGSHRGPLHELWHGGVFTGAIDDDLASEMPARAVRCTGPAGSACIMHTRLLHGSAANLSAQPRTLFIAVYAAEDAVPLAPTHLPSPYEGEIVRGRATGRIRASTFEMAIPEYPKEASFFNQQAKQRAAG